MRPYARGKPPAGSVVLVGFEPRAGICGSTREIASRLRKGGLPRGDRSRLSRKLYDAENHGKVNPSGSQDIIGTICPEINRLDYNFSATEGGVSARKISALACGLEITGTNLKPVARPPAN